MEGRKEIDLIYFEKAERKLETLPGYKYDTPNLEGRSTNQTFLPLMLWLIWLPQRRIAKIIGGEVDVKA